ncbi:MAG: hypothetical protein OJF60_001160 [Burkholderiaceae bacterium]|jgi:hypothetical protein|nr:MAG: hypothetical protein OJF60_001160 [Burkholderiaceae bacterium]
MAAKSDDSKKAAELKKQLEAIAGHEIDVSPAQILNLWYPVSASSTTDGSATWRSIFFPSKRCNDATLLDVDGTSSTGPNGQRTFLLSEVLCWTSFVFAYPANVVATPRGAAPFYLTTTYQTVGPQPGTLNTDLQITVYSWQPGGAAAPGVTFDWRCRVVSVPIIF